MNTLERTLVEKVGYARGWKNVRESSPERVVVFSARHKAEAHIAPTSTPMIWKVIFSQGPPTAELSRGLPDQGPMAATPSAPLAKPLWADCCAAPRHGRCPSPTKPTSTTPGAGPRVEAWKDVMRCYKPKSIRLKSAYLASKRREKVRFGASSPPGGWRAVFEL